MREYIYEKYISQKIDSLNTLIGVLDKVGIGIPVDKLFERGRFDNGVVGQFFYPSSPKEQMALAFSIINFLEQEGYSFSKKTTDDHGMLAYRKGKFFVGLRAGNTDGIAIFHEEA